MLILRRKKNESFIIGDNIKVTILECASDGVRVAIDAPRQIPVIREELFEAEEVNQNALAPNTNSVLSLSAALMHSAKQNQP